MLPNSCAQQRRSSSWIVLCSKSPLASMLTRCYALVVVSRTTKPFRTTAPSLQVSHGKSTVAGPTALNNLRTPPEDSSMHSIAVSERGGRLGSDIRKTDRLDAIHVDLTFLHFVTTAHFHMRACPDADAARDLSMANATPEAFGQSLRLRMSNCRNGFGWFAGGGQVRATWKSSTSIGDFRAMHSLSALAI